MRMIIIVVVAVLAVACGGNIPTETYCGTDAFYQIQKIEGGVYRLYLKVGDRNPQACRSFEWRDRAINLSAEVSSPEEARKVIERERQRYRASKQYYDAAADRQARLPDQK